MSRTANLHPMRSVPPFMVGIAAATAAEVSATLLLYTGPALMRSITVILAVQGVSFGLGLRETPGARDDLLASVRRRWLLCMATFLVATLYAASWSLFPDLAGSGLSQGLGLALLAAFPLYACGNVLSAMTTASVTEPTGHRVNIGAPAALGAALGFVATGVSLPQVLTPASLLLVCLVILSGGGLVYGSVLDARLRIHVRDRRPSPLGDVRVEDRHLPLRDRGARFLFEGRCLRRWMALESAAATPWDVAVFQSMFGDARGAPRILLVGGGASSLPRIAVHAHPQVVVDVVERSQAVVALGSEYLNTGLSLEESGRIELHVGNPEDRVAEAVEEYDLVLVDTAALCPVGGVASMTRFGLGTLARVVGPRGVLALGPLAPDADPAPTPDGWVLATFQRDLPEALQGLGDRRAGGTLPGERVVLTSPDPDATLPPPRDFEPVEMGRGVEVQAPDAPVPLAPSGPA